MHVFKYVFPIMLIVLTLAWLILDNSYQEVPWNIRVWISFGAAGLSGIMSYFLFKPEKEEKIDEKK